MGGLLLVFIIKTLKAHVCCFRYINCQDSVVFTGIPKFTLQRVTPPTAAKAQVGGFCANDKIGAPVNFKKSVQFVASSQSVWHTTNGLYGYICPGEAGAASESEWPVWLHLPR